MKKHVLLTSLLFIIISFCINLQASITKEYLDIEGENQTSIIKATSNYNFDIASSVKSTYHDIIYRNDASQGNTVIMGLDPVKYEVGVGEVIDAKPYHSTYTFAWWEDEHNTRVNSISTTADSTVTLYAVWTKDTRTITYLDDDTNGNTPFSGITPDAYRIGIGTTTLGTPPTRPNYTFIEWQDELGTPVTSISHSDSENITLYAVWKGDKKSITYKDDAANGNTIIPGLTPNEYEVGVGAIISAVPPTRSDSIFDGWQDANGSYVTSISDTETEDITLFATWKNKTYNISYVDNYTNSILNTNTSWLYSYTSNDIVTLPTGINLHNNSFIGWSSNKYIYVEINNIPTGSTGDKTVYAFFNEDLIIEPLTIYYYNLNNSTIPIRIDTIDTSKLPYSLTFSISENGNIFKGWSLNTYSSNTYSIVKTVDSDNIIKENSDNVINLYASLEDRSNIFVYPTIVDNYVTIETKSNNNTISIYSLNGSIVMRKEIQTTKERIAIGSLPPGLYIVHEEETGQTAKVLIK